MDERRLTYLGVATWLLIGIPSIFEELQRGTLFTPRLLAWLACYVVWVVLFVLTTTPKCPPKGQLPLIFLQSLLALACLSLAAVAFMPVLLVMVAAELGASVSLRVGAMWIVLQTVAFGLIFAAHSSEPVAAATAYLAFQVFGFLSLRIAHSEASARRELAEMHAELQVTNGLLDLNSRNEERLRIARDLHDLLGHHLTALSLNLEVASHKAGGEALEQIEKSKAITKLLLSDVRDVVSSLRHDEPVDLMVALTHLQRAIPKPVIELDVPQAVIVTDPQIAQVALRSIQEIVTNAVRHSGARTLRIRLIDDGRMVNIEARDDGAGADHVQYGNGLSGMRERLEGVGGSVEVSSARGKGFEVKIRLPRERAT
jgi:signal transduction histidine kinase